MPPFRKKRGHAAFDFPNGTLLLTEASTHKRASLHVVRGEEALAALDPGGVEPLEVDFHAFRVALLRENRTLKRALTDPRILSGIGNAHSDEILLHARLSPVRRTRQLDQEELQRLLRVDPPFSVGMGGAATYGFRRRVSREDHRVPRSDDGRTGNSVNHAHNAVRQSSASCTGSARPITARAARPETNSSRTGALSKLLREDWPATLEELEEDIEARRKA